MRKYILILAILGLLFHTGSVECATYLSEQEKQTLMEEIAEYNEEIKFDTNDGETYFFRGEAYERLGRKEMALADMKRAELLVSKELRDNKNLSFYKRGLYYSYLGEIKEKYLNNPVGAISYYLESYKMYSNAIEERQICDFYYARVRIGMTIINLLGDNNNELKQNLETAYNSDLKIANSLAANQPFEYRIQFLK